MLNASPMNPLTVLEMETNEGISLNKKKKTYVEGFDVSLYFDRGTQLNTFEC